MARTNPEAQRNRNKSGKNLEEEVGLELEDLLEDSRLQHVRMRSQYRFTMGRSGNTVKKIDFVLSSMDDRILVCIGCKSSLRERATQDAYLAGHIKKEWPLSIWVEIMRQEHPDDTGDSVRRACAKTLDDHEEFDRVVCTRDRDAMTDLRNFLKLHLLSELPGRPAAPPL